jgi:hypothetical protein
MKGEAYGTISICAKMQLGGYSHGCQGQTVLDIATDGRYSMCPSQHSCSCVMCLHSVT